MIGVTRSVLAPFAGSTQSLSRSLSPLDPVPPESSPATGRRQSFSHCKPLIHLPTGQFFRLVPHSKLQKAIQYPGGSTGSVK
jgi:hypothetical protein